MPTQEDLEKLEDAIFSGTRKVKYRDRDVEYQSMNEMFAARTLLISALQTETPLISIKVPLFDKGL